MHASWLVTGLLLAATAGEPASTPAGEAAIAPPGRSTAEAPTGADRARLAGFALEAAERAASEARQAVRAGRWEVARAHVSHLHGWLTLAARIERPTGELAIRWDFAAREARRLDGALIARDAGAARWADAALTLALADARASLGGGGGTAAEPAAPPAPTPSAAPRRGRDRPGKWEDAPLDSERPWSKDHQW